MEKKEIIQALTKALDLIKKNTMDAWEDNGRNTKEVVITEDFDKTAQDSCSIDDTQIFKYNGWKKELEKLLTKLKKE